MEGKLYELDPKGDVILTLRNPNAPFAAGIEDELQYRRDAQVTAEVIHLLKGIGAKKENKKQKKQKKRANIYAVTTPIEPLNEAANGPVAELEVLAENASYSTSFPRTVQGGSQLELRIRLSSKHLSLASPVFEKMLGGPWREGTATVPGSDHPVGAEDWDVDALLILMRIIHGRTREVPRSVSLELLAKIAVLVDYYECYEVTELVTERWIEKLKWPLPQEFGRDLVLWCLVSWVFCEADLFQTVTKTTIMKCEGPLPTLGLPIPNIIVGKQFHERLIFSLITMLEAIDRKRRESIDQIIAGLHDLLVDLRDNRLGCSFECSSILLGALTKQMNSNGILGLKAGSSLLGFSLEVTSKATRETQSPRWCSIPQVNLFGPSSRVEHSCNLQSLVQSKVQGLDHVVIGLQWSDFGKNRDLRRMHFSL
ncbi:hypothetical protein PG993_010801 [Apiospora rasikravindrae]|uniref:BTB domain-containing protein n=1 Tax=Apiospora rasikravindrae TaxID=990691 RepID=A0ABR1SCB6_9PEZI